MKVKRKKCVNWPVLIAVIFTVYPNQICYYSRKKKPQKYYPSSSEKRFNVYVGLKYDFW